MSTIDRNTLLHVLLLLLFAAVMGVAFPLTKVAEQDITPLTLAIGILSTGLGYAVLNYLIAHAGVIFAATSGYFIPVFAIVMGYFLVKEPITWLQVVGLGMTLVGARLVNRQPQPSS